jgi:hypothetical protein
MSKRRLLLLIVPLGLSTLLFFAFSSAPQAERVTDSSKLGSTAGIPVAQLLPTLSSRMKGQALNVVVDGGRHPEQVSDAYAFRHLFESTAKPEKASPQALAFIGVRIKRMGLSDSDRNAYEAVLHQGKVAETFDRLKAERIFLTTGPAPPGEDAKSRLRSIKSEEDELVSRTRHAVVVALSPAGVAKLHEHVTQAIKRQIRVLGGFSMDHSAGH